MAHRLSTIINSDKIIVLNKGEIHEVGNHDELMSKRGKYYTLVKSQVEKDSQKTSITEEINKPNNISKNGVVIEIDNNQNHSNLIKIVNDEEIYNEEDIEIKMENKENLNKNYLNESSSCNKNRDKEEQIITENQRLTNKLNQLKIEPKLAVIQSSKDPILNQDIKQENDELKHRESEEENPEIKEYFNQARKRLITLLNDAKCVIIFAL